MKIENQLTHAQAAEALEQCCKEDRAKAMLEKARLHTECAQAAMEAACGLNPGNLRYRSAQNSLGYLLRFIGASMIALAFSACATTGPAYGLKKDVSKEEAQRDYFHCVQRRNYDACMQELGYRWREIKEGDGYVGAVQ